MLGRTIYVLLSHNLCKTKPTPILNRCVRVRKLHNTPVCFRDPKDGSKDEIAIYHDFKQMENKNKKTFVEMVKIYESKGRHRRGHVEFIYSALNHMEEYGVHKDLEVYKALVDIFPKGKFIPQNMYQAEFMHYPKQQNCAVDVLEQMEDNGVIPDKEMQEMLLNIFGNKGIPLRKYWRMMYWMPKFKRMSPWPLPVELPDSALELAKLAVARISSVDLQSQVSVYQTADVEDSLDDTWIVSAQSKQQQQLLCQHDTNKPIYVEGAFKVWIREQSVNYFILRGDPLPVPEDDQDIDDVSNLPMPPAFLFRNPSEIKILVEPSVHEQQDGVIFGLCATGTSSRDSLLSWIRLLERTGNPALSSIPVVFRLKAPETEVANVREENEEQKPIEDS